jgi:hypothetical protein
LGFNGDFQKIQRRFSSFRNKLGKHTHTVNLQTFRKHCEFNQYLPILLKFFSTFDRMLGTPVPGTSQDQTHHDDGRQQQITSDTNNINGETWNLEIDRLDTLDRNPLCVDPRTVLNQMKVEAAPAPQPILQFQVVEQNGGPIWQPANAGNPIIEFGGEEFDFLQQVLTCPGGNGPGPTSKHPCSDDWTGELDFTLSFGRMSSYQKNKNWDVSILIFSSAADRVKKFKNIQKQD